MNEDKIFSVSKKLGVTIFENYSKYKLLVYLKPIKPKRKYIKVILVAPNSFTMFDPKIANADLDIDLTKVIFSLENESCDT